MLVNGNAAFEIDGIDQGSRTGWSVIIGGMTEEITSPSELRRLEHMGLETWTPGHKAHWMRIRAWTVTGRRIVLAGHLPVYVVFRSNGSELPGWRGESHAVAFAV